MSNIVKICIRHGNLTDEHVHKKKNKSKKGYVLQCNQCKLEKDRRWKESNREKHRASAGASRNKARKLYREGMTDEPPKANVWANEDRKKDREKYRRYERNYKEKLGIELVRKREVVRIHRLTIEEYDALIASQDNKCKACGKTETRLGRDGKTVTPLGVDHCHTCEERGKHVIRCLLCHACNTALGKVKDNIQTLKNMILILEEHKHIE